MEAKVTDMLGTYEGLGMDICFWLVFMLLDIYWVKISFDSDNFEIYQQLNLFWVTRHLRHMFARHTVVLDTRMSCALGC